MRIGEKVRTIGTWTSLRSLLLVVRDWHTGEHVLIGWPAGDGVGDSATPLEDKGEGGEGEGEDGEEKEETGGGGGGCGGRSVMGRVCTRHGKGVRNLRGILVLLLLLFTYKYWNWNWILVKRVDEGRRRLKLKTSWEGIFRTAYSKAVFSLVFQFVYYSTQLEIIDFMLKKCIF